MICVGEDALRCPALEIGLIKVEFRLILIFIWNLKKIELIIDFLHLVFPVFIVVVAFCPKEILVQNLWYNIL